MPECKTSLTPPSPRSSPVPRARGGALGGRGGLRNTSSRMRGGGRGVSLPPYPFWLKVTTTLLLLPRKVVGPALSTCMPSCHPRSSCRRVARPAAGSVPSLCDPGTFIPAPATPPVLVALVEAHKAFVERKRKAEHLEWLINVVAEIDVRVARERQQYKIGG